MRGNEYSELCAFAAVAREGNFRRAAAMLNLRPSTLSHSVRALEERLGVKLLARTTRSVAPTPAGATLLDRILPALAALEGAAETVAEHRSLPRGPVRLTSSQNAALVIIAPHLGRFACAFPDVQLEIDIDDGFVDVVREGFDAGIRIGESVAAGMTSIRISSGIRTAVVAAPDYWNEHGRPVVPAHLLGHRCINRRYGRGRAIHRWRFARESDTVEIACTGPLVLDTEWMMREAALQGAGVASLSENQVAHDLEAGRLERVLMDWCPPMYQYYLFHPSHRLPSASLLALIETLRFRDAPLSQKHEQATGA